ncbi:MAG: MIP family channel protein [Bacteroidota bacterium]|nr:MIP family channel protein [Bacteroidota bacterium]
MRKYLAEFIGTFALVFCGTGAIIINEQTDGAIGHAGIAITFGLIVLVMIYTFGDTSGAHFNPAVTIGFSIADLFNRKEILPYIMSQISGALLASGILKLLFPDNQNLGSTLPAGGILQAFVFEIILTYFLMLVILNVSQGSKEIGVLAGIAIGSTVLLEAMFAGPVSGASMNPARSLGPAIISGNIQTIWIYMIAPVIGAIGATLTWKMMNKNMSV